MRRMRMAAAAVMLGLTLFGCGQRVHVSLQANKARDVSFADLERFDVANTGVPMQAAGALRAHAEQAADRYILSLGPGVRPIVDPEGPTEIERQPDVDVQHAVAARLMRKGYQRDPRDPQVVLIADFTMFNRPYRVEQQGMTMVERTVAGPDGARRPMPQAELQHTDAVRRSLRVAALGLYAYNPKAARLGPPRFSYQVMAVAYDEYNLDEAAAIRLLIERAVEQFPKPTVGAKRTTAHLPSPVN